MPECSSECKFIEQIFLEDAVLVQGSVGSVGCYQSSQEEPQGGGKISTSQKPGTSQKDWKGQRHTEFKMSQVFKVLACKFRAQFTLKEQPIQMKSVPRWTWIQNTLRFSTICDFRIKIQPGPCAAAVLGRASGVSITMSGGSGRQGCVCPRIPSQAHSLSLTGSGMSQHWPFNFDSSLSLCETAWSPY